MKLLLISRVCSVTTCALSILGPTAGVIWWGNAMSAHVYEESFAKRKRAIVPMIRSVPDLPDVLYKPHICIDTTVAGGNVDLLDSVS